MKSNISITGMVTAVVRNANGSVANVTRHHNIVTNEGDALIADMMAETPARTKPDNTNAEMGVGTGFSSESKTSDALASQTGSSKSMESGYPQVKDSWGGTDDNVVQYKAVWSAGDLDVTDIDEAILTNGTDTLAYAEISPKLDVSSDQSLELIWELTILGS